MRYPDVANSALGLSLVALLVTFGLRTGSDRKPVVKRPSKWADVPAVLAAVQAPSIAIETLEGDTVEIAVDSQPNLVIAYRTTCPYSGASVKQWQDLASTRCDLRLALVSSEPIERQVAYWRLRPWTARPGCAPIAIGRPVSPAAFSRGFGVTGFPTHYAIDQRGVATGMWRGAVPSGVARDSLLAGLQRRLSSAPQE